MEACLLSPVNVRANPDTTSWSKSLRVASRNVSRHRAVSAVAFPLFAVFELVPRDPLLIRLLQ